MNELKINNTYNDYYYNKGVNSLSKEFKDIDKRLKFENWLIDQVFSKKITDISSKRHTKVISLLCKKTQENSGLSASNKKEDALLAKLITQMPPLDKRDQEVKISHDTKTVRLVHHVIQKIFNFSEIYNEIKDKNLTETSKSLLKKIIECQSILDTISQDIDLMKFLARNAPEEFNTILSLQNEQGQTLLHKIAIQNNLEMMEWIATSMPDQFKAILVMQDQDGWTPLHEAVEKDSIEMVRWMAKTAPVEFNAALSRQNKKGWTPLHKAVSNDNIEMVRLMANAAPVGFDAALSMQLADGWTPLQEAVNNDNIEMLRLMAKNAPVGFNAALPKQAADGWTVLFQAIEKENIEMVKLMAEAAPVGFDAALLKKTADDFTPVIRAAYGTHAKEMLTLLINKNPDALNILNDAGDSVLSLLKKSRPNNYREITRLFKDNVLLKQIHQAQLQRKALSHAWHLAGISPLIKRGEKNAMLQISLEGHLPPEWFHLMSKNLRPFEKFYPDFFTKDQMTGLKQLLDLGANFQSYSVEDRVKRIQAGLPTIINTGHSQHAVTLLVWKDLFVICNRGEVSRKPIEVYHFNPLKFSSKDLMEIEGVAERGTVDDYKKLLFNRLPQKLEFSQSSLDKLFEEVSKYLPPQVTSNCSIVSPFTAIYAFILIANVRGIDEASRLFDEKQLPEEKKQELTNQIKNALFMYETWLSNQQMSILESNIQPLENKENLIFEPDHSLIMGALSRAHSLPLDAHGQKRLERLTNIYLNFVDEKKRTLVKTHLASCQVLKKVPLL